MIQKITQELIVSKEVEVLYGKDTVLCLYENYLTIVIDYACSKYKDFDDKSLGQEDIISYDSGIFRKTQINQISVSYDNDSNVWFIYILCDSKSTWLNVESKEKGLLIQQIITSWLFN